MVLSKNASLKFDENKVKIEHLGRTAKSPRLLTQATKNKMSYFGHTCREHGCRIFHTTTMMELRRSQISKTAENDYHGNI